MAPGGWTRRCEDFGVWAPGALCWSFSAQEGYEALHQEPLYNRPWELSEILDSGQWASGWAIFWGNRFHRISFHSLTWWITKITKSCEFHCSRSCAGWWSCQGIALAKVEDIIAHLTVSSNKLQLLPLTIVTEAGQRLERASLHLL